VDDALALTSERHPGEPRRDKVGELWSRSHRCASMLQRCAPGCHAARAHGIFPKPPSPITMRESLLAFQRQA
jgi:hypothetical protein